MAAPLLSEPGRQMQQRFKLTIATRFPISATVVFLRIRYYQYVIARPVVRRIPRIKLLTGARPCTNDEKTSDLPPVRQVFEVVMVQPELDHVVHGSCVARQGLFPIGPENSLARGDRSITTRHGDLLINNPFEDVQHIARNLVTPARAGLGFLGGGRRRRYVVSGIMAELAFRELVANSLEMVLPYRQGARPPR